MDSIFRLTQRVKQFVQGSASSSSSEIGKEISDILGDLQSVRRTSAWIKAVLADAEERALRGEELVKQWLIDLHHLNYRAADLLGLYEYEVAAQQIRDEEASATAAKGKRKLDQVYNSSPLTDPSFRQEFALGIRKFRDDFDEINKLKEALRFDKEDGEKYKQRRGDMLEHPPTGSEPVDDLFFGRENKLRELIGYLLTDGIEEENDPNCKRVPVIALVGMGGVGKTTLAQHAFNDPKVCEIYSRRGWVWVSDNFHVQRVTRLTLEAFKERSNDKEEFSALQSRLKDVAKKTKFLLVLDDVWNENMVPWDTFYSSLRDGAEGSKIIITTRSKTVADTAQALKCIDVSCLSDDDAWNFFQTVVFGDHGKQHEFDHPASTNVGKKITERCKGLPLAIKVLGRYLRCHNKDLHISDEVLESKLLQPHVFGEINQVFGPLILSYLHLSACVKPCFVLSSVFRKGTEITKEDLINFWIAHELVEDCNVNTGMLYIQNLVARSFFEIREYEEEEYITIHDIIHDVAMHLSRDKMLHKTNGDDQGNNLLIPEEVQHAFISSWHETAVQLKFGITDTASGLRTLRVEGEMEKLIVDPNPVNLNSLRSFTYTVFFNNHYQSAYFSYEYLKRLKNLRHLELPKISPEMVTQGKFDAIGTLYNLRTLKISFVYDEDGISFPVCICNLRQLIHLTIDRIRDVPDSIGCLTKLYKLDLNRSSIRCLPESIANLKALRVLNLEWCTSLIKLPASIGELKALEVLNLDICAALIELPASIGELKALELLNLDNCEALIELPASIGELEALKVLKLNRCGSLNLDECQSLEGLPAGIKKLTNLQRLEKFRVPPRELVAHKHFAGIEELRELVCIRGDLTIEGLENVATQAEAKQSELNNKRHIRELRLVWSDSPSEKERDAAQAEQVLQGLRPHANLEMLEIYEWSGRKLASWLGDTSFVNLKEIEIAHIPNCKSLTPIHQLPSLRSLYCCNMTSLLYLTPTSFLCSDSDIRNSCFPALETLEFDDCPRLVLLADSMPLLKDLKFGECDSVRDLEFDSLPALEDLHVYNCSNLWFSDSTVFPSSLRRLRISRCNQPFNWCRAHRQSKLAHLPNVHEWSYGIEFSR